jgi:hypothetical protein
MGMKVAAGTAKPTELSNLPAGSDTARYWTLIAMIFLG